MSLSALLSASKGRAMAQASANTETHTGVIKRITRDKNGNTVDADVTLQGQSYPVEKVANASGLRLFVGMRVAVSYKRGIRLKPEITGAAGAEAGATLSTAASVAANAAYGTASSASDLSGIAFLLANDDATGTVPDALTEVPGANVLIEDTSKQTTSGGTIGGRRTISAKVLVATSLPNPATTGLPDGTLLDLQSSYGQPLGMYRLDKGAKVWRRRDAGTGGNLPPGSGGSTTATIVTELPTPTLTNRGVFYLLSAGDAFAGYNPHILSLPSLTHFWECEESSGMTAADSKGTSDGTITGGTVTIGSTGVTSESNTSFSYSRYGGYLSIPNASDIPMSTGCDSAIVNIWTIECCFYLDSSQTYYANLLSWGGVGVVAGIPSGGSASLFLINCSRESGINATINQNTLYHFALTSDNVNMRMYINGVQVSSSALSAGNMDTGTIKVGSHDTQTDTRFVGRIGKVACYNTALSAATILANYNASVGIGGDETIPDKLYISRRTGVATYTMSEISL